MVEIAVERPVHTCDLRLRWHVWRTGAPGEPCACGAYVAGDSPRGMRRA